MNRLKISLLVLVAFFALCFSLNAQIRVVEKNPDSAPKQAEPQKEQSITFAPGPTTALRVMQLVSDIEQEGKFVFLRLEMDEYKQFIGLTPAQELLLESQFQALNNEENEQKGRAYIDQLNRWQELPSEEITKVENELFDFYSQMIDETHSLVHEILTPEQLQKAMEYELTVPSTISQILQKETFLNFSAFDALELSEEQKEKITKIQEELKSESNEFFKEFIDEVKKLPKEGKELSEEAQNKLMEKLSLLEVKGKALAHKFQSKAEEVLTPEQRTKLTTLREEIPKKLASIREELAKKAKETPEDESWKDSWKPGDPLPEGAVPPQRKPRFPFKL